MRTVAMTELAAETRLGTVKSRVAWGAIFAGALVAIALFFVLGSFTAALNLSLYEEQPVGIPTWAFALSIVCMFVGGWTTARLAAGESRSEVVFYGIILWSFTALVMLYLAMNGILIFGSSTVLGQSSYEDLLIPMSKSAAWWGFAGVTLSLAGSIAGSMAGVRSLHVSRRGRAIGAKALRRTRHEGVHAH